MLGKNRKLSMKSLSYLNKYFFKYKWRLLLGILCVTGQNFFSVEMPVYTGRVLDELEEGVSPENAVQFTLTMVLIYLGLAAASKIFLFFQRQMLIIMSRNIEFDLKNEIYQQYQNLGFTFYKKNSTGDLMNRISEDVTKVRMYLGPCLMYSINLLALSILVIYNMVQINGELALFVLIPLPIMSFLIYKVSSRMNQLSTIVQEEQSKMSTHAQEFFSGIRVIKAYGRGKDAEGKFNHSADRYKDKSMRLVLINALFMPTIFMLIGLSTLLCIYLGGLYYGHKAISLGDIIAFIIYVNLLTWPFASIGWVTSLVQRAAASQTRINEFLEVESEITNNSEAPLKFEHEIEFKNVSFTYKDSGIQAIKNLSFKLSKGETLGIVGRTGSGKSTIFNLLMRQLDPDSGEILVDGVSLKDINLNTFKAITGIVPQDVFLFSDTIRNNLSFGTTEKVDDERLIEISKRAHVYHNIIEFKDQFDTILGERGVNLSGGQKQRISIARALIRNPQLLLLDDCLSAVDTETEEIILNNLKNEGTTTSIIVSHRVSSLRHAKRILVISEGGKLEEGSHNELLELNGSYAEMYHKQLDESDDEN
ncbi:MAG: ATP-binding cassette subfamily B multidrug efflux pump [Crocinitomicaceae bacterium]|jgi:ATP-binding cassette subfamily B multidrug efflux pump